MASQALQTEARKVVNSSDPVEDKVEDFSSKPTRLVGAASGNKQVINSAPSLCQDLIWTTLQDIKYNLG